MGTLSIVHYPKLGRMPDALDEYWVTLDSMLRLLAAAEATNP